MNQGCSKHDTDATYTEIYVKHSKKRRGNKIDTTRHKQMTRRRPCRIDLVSPWTMCLCLNGAAQATKTLCSCGLEHIYKHIHSSQFPSLLCVKCQVPHRLPKYVRYMRTSAHRRSISHSSLHQINTRTSYRDAQSW